MSAFSAPQFSSAQASSITFVDDDNTFTISIEALIKAAAINQTPITNKNSQLVKQTKFLRTHKRSKSRIHPKPQNSTEVIPNKSSNMKFTHLSEHKLSYYPPRLLTLFLLGSITSFVIDHLLTQNHITEYPKDITKLIDTAAWIPPTCGVSAVLVGSLFPLADYLFMRKPQDFQREWSNVMRCMGGFIGVAYAATKLPWNSNYQVSCTLALISIVLWFLFDRTSHGFMMSALFSSIGTGVMYMLVSNGIYSFTHADFFGVRSWIPCILYSSCVCFGTVGRQLMIVPEEWFEGFEEKEQGKIWEVKTKKLD